jgi:heme o synthase
VKTAVTLPAPLLPDAGSSAVPVEASGHRTNAFVALTKPRIAVMVLFTVFTGFVAGVRGSTRPWTYATLIMALLGTALVAASASVWNQIVERVRDARMRRTARRPLPRGLVTVLEAGWFGSVLGLAGLAILALGANMAAAGVALATFVLYVLVYTPLKPVTTVNTAVGAVPGALPPLIGWAAATGNLGIEAWALFLIVFLWQFPHFLAIAWIHRDDYARGGHRMLPSVDPSGSITARQAVIYGLALVPAGLMPAILGMAGPFYFVGALALGLYYFAHAIGFWRGVSDASARRLLYASFWYLPAVLSLLLLNPTPV